MNAWASRLTAVALAGLAACAADSDSGGPQGRAPPPTRPLPNVFISPEGEPFRAPDGAPYPVAAWFARADADHDGKLTAAEFRQDAIDFFRTLDLNHDGVLDGAEVARYEDEVAPEILPSIGRLAAGEGADPNLTYGADPAEGQSRRRFRQPAQPRDANDVGLQGAGLYGLMNEPEPVAAADTAFNGRISLRAFVEAADRRFQMLDTRGLGYLTLNTLPKTPIQVENARRAKLRHDRESPDRQEAGKKGAGRSLVSPSDSGTS